MESRKSAEIPARKEREQLLKAVDEKGFMTGYSGIHISSTGKRFCLK
jgi:hypothetical protein